jgi:hypothetical protein
MEQSTALNGVLTDRSCTSPTSAPLKTIEQIKLKKLEHFPITEYVETRSKAEHQESMICHPCIPAPCTCTSTVINGAIPNSHRGVKSPQMTFPKLRPLCRESLFVLWSHMPDMNVLPLRMHVILHHSLSMTWRRVDGDVKWSWLLSILCMFLLCVFLSISFSFCKCH